MRRVGARHVRDDQQQACDFELDRLHRTPSKKANAIEDVRPA